LRLGIDIDGTIKNTMKAAVKLFNKELKKNVKLEQVSDFYLDRAYGLTKEMGRKVWNKLEEDIYRQALPLDNACEVLNNLVRRGHELFFITARPDIGNIHNITVEWLKKYKFPYNGKNLIMNAKNKAKIAKDLRIDLFFEDAPFHLENLIAAGIKTVIVAAPYNSCFPKSILRITDWRQVYNLFP